LTETVKSDRVSDSSRVLEYELQSFIDSRLVLIKIIFKKHPFKPAIAEIVNYLMIKLYPSTVRGKGYVFSLSLSFLPTGFA
jgi:acetolactate synthase small subunit